MAFFHGKSESSSKSAEASGLRACRGRLLASVPSNLPFPGGGLPSPYPLPVGWGRGVVGWPEQLVPSQAPQDGSKTSPGAPRRLQDSSKTLQDAPRSVQDVPRHPRNAPRHPQHTLKTPQDASKTRSWWFFGTKMEPTQHQNPILKRLHVRIT